jgi:predicted metal-dependent TIM-barrel fold hydrolase/sugar phosphate isomerase/epimerase
MSRVFDPHIHMSSRTTDDYEAMAAAGVRAVVEPAFWLGQPRTSVGSFVDYFSSLLGWEPYRAEQFGVTHFCALALNPKEANDAGLREDVLALLPRFLLKERVLCVGEVGYDSITPAEDEAFARQLQLAIEHQLPVMVHTPHRDKAEGTRRSLAVVRESGIAPELVLVDHNNELTVGMVLDSGCWAGFSIYPETKMDEQRMVRVLREHGLDRMLVNSAADWGRSDPLKTVQTGATMADAGFSADDVDRVLWGNPVAFYGQSGRLLLPDTPLQPRAAPLRGQQRRSRGAGWSDRVRFRHPGGQTIHLAYCSNVHPADDAEGVLAQLSRFAAPVRSKLGVRRLGIGLWLSGKATAAFDAEAARLAALRTELDRLGLEVVTLNGFPYGDFHAERVKHAVYVPDWTTAERAQHTLRLARLLATLLPDDVVDGSISSLPLAWREPWTNEQSSAARSRLREVADGLADLQERTGRRVRLALEPEPGCVVETTGQLADLIATLDTGDWVGGCVDTAHLTVQFEPPELAVPALAARGVAIVKAQVSAGLRVPDPGSPDARAGLASFVEPRFLHQARSMQKGILHGTDDLDEALDGGLSAQAEWRVHVHVPLHSDPADTTAAEVAIALRELVGGPRPLTRHLEVETYTWSVLPPGLRPVDEPGLVDGISRELGWTRDRLAALGLEELS